MTHANKTTTTELSLNSDQYDWFVDRFGNDRDQLFCMIITHFFDQYQNEVDGRGLRSLHDIHEMMYPS